MNELEHLQQKVVDTKATADAAYTEALNEVIYYLKEQDDAK